MIKERPIGQYLVETLVANGIDTVFGIPGVHTLELYRGLVGAPIRHVLTRHEQGAAFAADGYARISGRPAACVLISGPGLANAMTAIGQAYSDSQPMIVVSAAPGRSTLGKARGVLHEMKDQQAMAETVTAFSATCLTGEDVRDALAHAFALFATGRPRPVHLEVPIDRFSDPTDLVPVRFPSAFGKPRPSEAALSAAASAIAAARRPVLIVGGGAVDAGPAVSAFAEATGAKVVTTTAGKGVIPDDHPLHLGATLSWPAVQTCIAEADVVVAAGTELGETDTYVETLSIPGTLVRIDIDTAKLSDRYRAAVPILADAGETLLALARQVARPATGVEDAGAIRSRAVDHLDRKTLAHKSALDAIRRALPIDGAVVTDMTQIAYSGNALFPTSRPRSWFHPSGFGTLGFALPAAIGAKIAAPARPVLALAGDYGFQFTLQDLGTAAEERLPIPILVWNNDKLGQIRDDMVASGIQEIGVSLKNPDFRLIAAAYDVPYAAPESPVELETAIATALDRDRPTVIEIKARHFGDT